MNITKDMVLLTKEEIMKSIKISNRTYEKLVALHTGEDTFDTIIQRLIAVHESLALMVTIGRTGNSQKVEKEQAQGSSHSCVQ